jgi:dTDP-4-amino-4,6-dideoxygalactose transaminase
LPSADPSNLPIAERVAQEVLCLPMFGDLSENIIEFIISYLKK